MTPKQAAPASRSDETKRPFQDVTVTRVQQTGRATESDRVSVEEPLEVRLDGRTFAVIMRTPGADRELAAGFLLAERIIRAADDLGTIEVCVDVDNVVNVTLTGGAAARVDRALAGRRHVVANAACGVCGRTSIEELLEDIEPIADPVRISSSSLAALPDRLRAAQPLFDATGGLHAAALFRVAETLATLASVAALELVDTAEDVGRHNAVDKVIGRALMRDVLPLSSHVLLVSGRTSFEIVQKAFAAGIPVVAAVSAPSSLAVDLSRRSGITLAGFVRDGQFNVYTHAERIT